MKIRLHKDAFFRDYNGIGYLFQQRDNRNLVLDKNGIVFFQFITRKAKNINNICNEIYNVYKNTDISVITNDFLTFISKMEKLKFVIIGETEKEIKGKETKNAVSKGQEPSNKKTKILTNNYENDINTVLQKHFDKYPQLISLVIEITPNCNLKCIHCYLGCGSTHQTQYVPMITYTICRVLNEFRNMGGLQVTFTGGEAMLNQDLPKILEYARKLDLSITILTNGVLLNKEILTSIIENNIAKVQVSLYSMQSKVHDFITQLPNSFQQTKNNIEKLIKNDIKVQIACPVMKENIGTFDEVLKYGNKYGIKVRSEGTIIARTDFSNDNLAHRLTLEEYIKFVNCIIKNNPDYQERLLNNVGKEEKFDKNEQVCGAGRNTLCLSANGDYYPCPGFKLKLGNCEEHSLKEIWENSIELNKLRHLTNSSYTKCMQCADRNYCNLCPGKLYNESGGDMFKLSDYFCEVAHLTRKIAEEFVKKHKK